MLIETDNTMKTLSKNFNSIKLDNIKRVVMNSILILNKENFYSQLNQALEKKKEDLIMQAVKESEETEEEDPDLEHKEIKRYNGNTYLYENNFQDDPFLNPDHYFLRTEVYHPLEDLHIVFRSEENDSSLIS